MAAPVEIDPTDRHLGEQLARLVPAADRDALVGLVLGLRHAEREGSSRLPLDPAILGPLTEALGLGPEVLRLAAELRQAPDRLAPVVGAGDAFRPLSVEDGCLHAQRMRALEQRLAEGLARLAAAPPVPGAEAALAEVLARPPVLGGRPLVLSDEQRAAVAAWCPPMMQTAGVAFEEAEPAAETPEPDSEVAQAA